MKKLAQLLPSGLLIATIVLAALVFTARRANAQTILHAAQMAEPPRANGVFFLFQQAIVYQRTNPNQSEPPDPYHALGLPSSSISLDTWIKIEDGNVVQSHSIQRDMTSGTILFENIFDGKQRTIYDGSGYLSHTSASDEKPIPYENDIPFLDYAEQESLSITGVETSFWGTEAWVVESEQTNGLIEILMSYDETSRPYLIDLDIEALHYQWFVDKESERLVTFKWWAVTEAGPVILEQIDFSSPRILNSDELPSNWLLPSVPDAPTIHTMDAITQPELVKDLDQILAIINYPVLLPNSIPGELTQVDAVFNATKPQLSDSNWKFDIQDAAGHGLALQVMYFHGTETRLFVVIQGPSDLLVPLIKTSRASWFESHLVEVEITGNTIPAWVASGGSLDVPPAQVIVMFEYDNLFFFVVGQEYSETETLEFVSRFHPVEN